MFLRFRSLSTTLRSRIFLLYLRKRYLSRIIYFNVRYLNYVNYEIIIFLGRRKVISYYAYTSYQSEQLLLRTLSSARLITIGRIQITLSSLLINLSSSWSSSRGSPPSIRESVSIITFFFLGTYIISKSQRRIYIIQRIIRALGRSVIVRFSYTTSVLVSVLIVKRILYSYSLNFLSIYRSALYSNFIISYLRSTRLYNLLSYLYGCLFFYESNYIRYPPNLVIQLSIARITSLVSSLYYRGNRASIEVRAFFRLAIASSYSSSYLNSTSFFRSANRQNTLSLYYGIQIRQYIQTPRNPRSLVIFVQAGQFRIAFKCESISLRPLML